VHLNDGCVKDKVSPNGVEEVDVDALSLVPGDVVLPMVSQKILADIQLVSVHIYFLQTRHV